MRRRGLSLVEVIVAIGIAMFGFVTLITVFRANYKQSNQSRNRTVACSIMQSWMDEIEAHPYGLAAPPSWSTVEETPAKLWIEGRPQEMIYHKTITFENGGFVGTGASNTDMVTIKLTWREGMGKDQSTHPTDDRELVVKVPVWR
jgi:Tfp pilus assembly protein PilV